MPLNTATSIVDYLKSVGKPSDYNYRSTLAGQYGIAGYQGTSQQNTQLLALLASGGVKPAAPAAAPVAAPASTPAAIATPAVTPTTTPRADYLSGMITNMQNTNTTNQAKTDEARKALIDYYAKLESPLTTYENVSAKYSLPEQQKLVNTLTTQAMSTQDLIDKIEPSVTQRTGDFFVNEADRTAITAREQKPLLDSLNKLLRQKQAEDVTLTSKQNLVAQLVAYSIEDQKNKARPYELGVDYTTADQKAANDLLSSILSTTSSSYNADVSAAETKTATKEDQAFQLEKLQKQFANDVALTKIKASTSGTSDKKALTDKAWSQIIQGSNTEYDVWKKINDNQEALKAQGIDVQDLWGRHKMLAMGVGQGGKIKNSDNTIGLTGEEAGYY